MIILVEMKLKSYNQDYRLKKDAKNWNFNKVMQKVNYYCRQIQL